VALLIGFDRLDFYLRRRHNSVSETIKKYSAMDIVQKHNNCISMASSKNFVVVSYVKRFKVLRMLMQAAINLLFMLSVLNAPF
jgi:hypothetical protein